MKITLFMCAGNLAETLGIHHVHEMDGVGRRMPWTMGAFTVAALGMIGILRWPDSSASGTWAWGPSLTGSPGCSACSP